MYEDRFGTDWTSIDDREEAVRRAFALGVAARMGEHYPGELDKISDEVESNYDRSFVELAYHEGRDKADRVDPEPDDDANEVWEQVVAETTQLDPSDRPDEPEPHEKEGMPGALGGYDIDTRPDDSREAVGRPKFLSRRDAEEPEHRRRRSRSSSSSGGSGDDEEKGPTDEERAEFEEILDPDSGSDGDS
ncbi:hypothetical protein [Salinarchaeum laminariae]|uniref:hypothetical protein n=1 Tax=Salinarchaeum laminariae TaxID=869888 RepID=UPI0020BEA535|nr:hypothetical protein [Salinarchaeum laminariae]